MEFFKRLLPKKKHDTGGENIPVLTETEPKAPRLKEDQVQLDVPQFDGEIIEVAYRTPEMKQKIYDARESFKTASEIIAVTGSFGLGDSIMELRYVLQLAKKTQKKFLIQIHPALMPLFSNNNSAFPNMTFCEKVPFQKAEDAQSFLMRLTPTSRVNESLNWVDWSGTTVDPKNGDEVFSKRSVFDQKRDAGMLADSQFFMPLGSATTTESMRDIQKNLEPHLNPQANSFDQIYGMFSAFLDEPTSSEEIRRSSILPYDKEILNRIPQTYDLMIAPDAGERSNGGWSNKSLAPDAWNTIFSKPEFKNKKVAILMGVAHPKYCEAIIKLAEKNGIECEVIKGNLDNISKQILATKTFIGMDSGTTHLAADVSRFAKEHGRSIVIKEIIDEYQQGHVEDYAITDTPILRYEQTSFNSMEKNFNNLEPDEIEQVGNYFLAA